MKNDTKSNIILIKKCVNLGIINEYVSDFKLV